MGLKSDRWIEQACNGSAIPLIDPFVKKQIQKGVVSYGLSSCGYDIRVGYEFQVFNNLVHGVIDVKNFNPKMLAKITGKECIIPPNSFALARSMEYIRMPNNILAICMGKSTYARAGIITNVTPLEPGWEGTITLEISNTTPCPVKIYAGEGLVQVLFFETDDPVVTTYDRKGGKYQGQRGITLPKVRK
jgi:dCTP deaminase